MGNLHRFRFLVLGRIVAVDFNLFTTSKIKRNNKIDIDSPRSSKIDGIINSKINDYDNNKPMTNNNINNNNEDDDNDEVGDGHEDGDDEEEDDDGHEDGDDKEEDDDEDTNSLLGGG